MNPESDENLPLHDEAEAREKWRGGETILKGSEGGSLPASDTAEGETGDDGGDGRPGKGSPGTIPPPD